jgi:hypothetical protein
VPEQENIIVNKNDGKQINLLLDTIVVALLNEKINIRAY